RFRPGSLLWCRKRPAESRRYLSHLPMIFVAGTLCLIFLTLAFLHLYWACGGEWASSGAVPERPDGRSLFRPSGPACVVVAVGLFAFGYVCLAHVELLPRLIFTGWTKRILLAISG